MILQSFRGTKLYRNSSKELDIQVKSNQIEYLLIQGGSITTHKLKTHEETIHIHPIEPFMIVNLSSTSLHLSSLDDLSSQSILFDPYQFEENPFDVLDPDEFQTKHTVPDGYIDILPKWYSIKFIYPTKNLIFIRPHLGISIQSHTKRTEDWKIMEGHPVIIANSCVYYSVNPGDAFHTDRGKMHSVFNTTDDWVVIEEQYTGNFQEEDIVRIFNPNHYQ